MFFDGNRWYLLWNPYTVAYHSDVLLLYSSTTSCTPASTIVKLIWSYIWYGESIISAVLVRPAFLTKAMYVEAWPITFPPVARKPSLPAENSPGWLWKNTSRFSCLCLCLSTTVQASHSSSLESWACLLNSSNDIVHLLQLITMTMTMTISWMRPFLSDSNSSLFVPFPTPCVRFLALVTCRSEGESTSTMASNICVMLWFYMVDDYLKNMQTSPLDK